MAISDNLTSGAAAAVDRATSVLKPYADEPQIAALLGKLNAIAQPADFSGDPDALAKNEEPTTEQQLAHLRRFNPRAAEVWERTRAGDPYAAAAFADRR